MNRMCWWLVDLVSRMLDPSEQDAVRGDFAESGQTGVPALRDVLGLVIRRQAALWKDWRPWLVLFGLIGPVSLLLSATSTRLGSSYDLNFWIIRNYSVIDPGILKETGITLRRGLGPLAISSLVLVCWSWASGFVLGRMSRRTIWIHGPLFCLALLWGEILAAPKHQLGVTFYSLMFPLALQLLLVLLPALWGMRMGLLPATRPLIYAILWAAAIVTLAGWRWFWWPWPSQAMWKLQLLLLARFWPLGYLVATAIWHRRRGQPAGN
jgi:hypothetical protein